MCSPRAELAFGQRGAALIVALLVFALSAALMVGLQRDFSLLLQRASNTMSAEQSWHYLRGAEALAVLALRADAELDAKSTQPVDDLNELWAQPTAPYALDEGGWLSGQLEDLQGRVNVNALGNTVSGDEAPRFTIQQKMFIRLVQALDGVTVSRDDAIALTEAIADFIDNDDTPRFNGAESNSYRNNEWPVIVANRPLASVSELRSVKGMTPELYRALAPLVSAWPPDGAALNWRTASLPVVRSFNADDSLDPMPLADAQRIVDLRAQSAIPDLDALFDDAVFVDRDIGGLRTVLTERSDWFLLRSEVEIAERMRRLYSVLARNGRRITVVYRTDSEP